MTDSTQHPTDQACTGCAVTGRRDFLLDALRAGAMALAAIGIAPSDAQAMPLRWITALSSSTQEKCYTVPAGDGVLFDKENEVTLPRVGKKGFGMSLA